MESLENAPLFDPEYHPGRSESEFYTFWMASLGLPLLVGAAQALRIAWYFQFDFDDFFELSTWGSQEQVLLLQPLVNLGLLELIQGFFFGADQLLRVMWKDKLAEGEIENNDENEEQLEVLWYWTLGALAILPGIALWQFFSAELFSGLAVFIMFPLIIVVFGLTFFGFKFLSDTVSWGMPLVVAFLVMKIIEEVNEGNLVNWFMMGFNNLLDNGLLFGIFLVLIVLAFEQAVELMLLGLTFFFPYLFFLFPGYLLLNNVVGLPLPYQLFDVGPYSSRIATLLLGSFLVFYTAAESTFSQSKLEMDLSHLTPMGVRSENYVERSIGWVVEIGQVASYVLVLAMMSYNYVDLDQQFRKMQFVVSKAVYNF